MQSKRTLHKDDVASAIMATDIYDFLITLVSTSASNAAAADTAVDIIEVEWADFLSSSLILSWLIL